MSELDFTLSLIDNITKPIRQVQSAVSGFAKNSQIAFGKIAVGGAGLAASFWSVKNILDPAIEMNDAMMTASLQGIDSGVMDNISKDALKFAAQYGKSSIDFVNSTTAISKAINGLNQHDLPQLTRITNTTAAALKTSSDEATAYMGQMFNQFESQANAIGHVKFAEDLAGKAVYMSKAFGVSMSEITSLMEGAKNAGTQFGVGIDEQLAVLGELQRTLGGESSGAYESFMKTAQDGAKKLGLSFVNASGQMLSMPEMLDKLQAKYGASIEGNLKAQKEIEAAFGDSAVVVKQLYGNVDILRKNIGFLGASDGMKRTTEQAAKLANPWERLMSIWQSIRIAIGMTLLPVITPLIDKLAEGGQTLVRWFTLFPNIARWVGYLTMGTLGFAAAGASANIVMGVSKFIMTGLLPLFKLVKFAALGAASGFTAISWPILGIIAVIAALTVVIVRCWQPIKAFIAGFIQGFLKAFGVLPPISEAFVEIGGAIKLVWNGIKYLFSLFTQLLKPIQYTSDELNSAAAAGSTFGYLVASAIKLILLPFSLVFDAIWQLSNMMFEVGKYIYESWNAICDFFSNSPIDTIFNAMGDTIKSIFSGVWQSIKDTFASVYNSIVEKLNYLPGVNIETKTTGTVDGSPAPASGAALLIGGQIKEMEKGGISRQISNNRTQSVDNSKRFDNVHINVTNGMSPTDLAEWTALENG